MLTGAWLGSRWRRGKQTHQEEEEEEAVAVAGAGLGFLLQSAGVSLVVQSSPPSCRPWSPLCLLLWSVHTCPEECLSLRLILL